MAKKELKYDWYTDGFSFACPECETETRVGVERLAKSPTFECYQCGTNVTIEHADEMVEAFGVARSAMAALHSVIDKRKEATRAFVLGAEIFRAYVGN